MLQTLKQNTFKISVLLIFSYLTFLMVEICLIYFPWSDHSSFLVLKQDVIHQQPWRLAFQIHVVSSSFALLAGFTQFFSLFRTKKYKVIHHYGGYLYLITVLGFALPSGFILALDALGGTSTQITFVLLSLFWATSTLLAICALFQKNWLKHRDWMIRSFALTLSALSLRSWKLVLYQLAPYWDWLSPMHIYQLQSWLGWTINLIIAEIIIFKLYQRQAQI